MNDTSTDISYPSVEANTDVSSIGAAFAVGLAYGLGELQFSRTLMVLTDLITQSNYLTIISAYFLASRTASARSFSFSSMILLARGEYYIELMCVTPLITAASMILPANVIFFVEITKLFLTLYPSKIFLYQLVD